MVVSLYHKANNVNERKIDILKCCALRAISEQFKVACGETHFKFLKGPGIPESVGMLWNANQKRSIPIFAVETGCGYLMREKEVEKPLRPRRIWEDFCEAQADIRALTTEVLCLNDELMIRTRQGPESDFLSFARRSDR